VIKRILIFILYFACCRTMYAAPGPLFNVTSTGPSASISMTLCLNGLGPLSCQNYTTSSSNITIKTTVPNHTYSNAGIKIITPGYAPAGCTMNANGYCLFSVSDTQSSLIIATPSACQAPGDAVVFFSSSHASKQSNRWHAKCISAIYYQHVYVQLSRSAITAQREQSYSC